MTYAAFFFDLDFNSDLRADWQSSSTAPKTLLKLIPKVMRPGPQRPAIAGPKIVIKHYSESTDRWQVLDTCE